MKRRNREGDGSDSMENTIRNTGSLEDKNDVGYGSIVLTSAFLIKRKSG